MDPALDLILWVASALVLIVALAYDNKHHDIWRD